MSLFPGAISSFTGFTSGHTLSADQHASQHNSEQAEIIATQTKVGTGASTPTNHTVLKGNGTGTSAWGQVDLTTDVTGVLPVGSGGIGQNSLTGLTLPSATLSNPSISGTVPGGATYSSPILTTPTIADFTNATHTHANAAGGGQLTGSSALIAATLKAAQMFKGMVYRRQGSTTGDNAWWGAGGGTSNTDTSAKDVFIQVGNGATSGDTTVTFPVAYNQIPIVIATTSQASGFNTFTIVLAVTTTTFQYRQVDTGGTQRNEACAWIAIGQ